MPTYRGQKVDVILDVRSRLEFILGHIQGAVCIPVDTVAAEVPRRRNISTTSTILVYCQSGARSATAAGQLRQLGYRKVLDGGGIASVRRELKP